MVHHHNEHRSHIDFAPSIALPRTLAQGHFRHFLCSESCPIPPLHLHIFFAVHYLSADIPGRAATSTPKSVFGNVSRRPCNTYKYDRLGVRASVGSWHGYTRMGFMVD